MKTNDTANSKNQLIVLKTDPGSHSSYGTQSVPRALLMFTQFFIVFFF